MPLNKATTSEPNALIGTTSTSEFKLKSNTKTFEKWFMRKLSFNSMVLNSIIAQFLLGNNRT